MVPFHNGAGVHIPLLLPAVNGKQLLQIRQFFLQNSVVILSMGVKANAALPLRTPTGAVIIIGQADDGTASGKHFRRIRAPLRGTRHPLHPGVPSVLQPLKQFFRMRAFSRTGHPAAGKTKLPGHGAQGIFNNRGIRSQHAGIMNKSVPPTKNFLLSGGNWIACTPPPLHNAAYMNIRILSDGKQGHLNQSLGLAQALISKAGGTVETVNLQGLSLLGKIRKVVSGSDIPRPDLFISAGHATHIPLICARHHFKTRAILCMKPTLPCSFFDLCLIPRHDLDSGRDYTDTNIFPTQGALHPMRPDTSVPKDTTLILIGGPSKDFDWDDESMLNQLAFISIHTPGHLVLTTSRRTPDGFAEKIRTAVPELTVVPVEETRPGWVARHLAHASAAWVSQDSVSMVYEALGSGAPVGILSVPRRHGSRKSRILSGLETLEKEGMVTGYSDWKKQNFRLTAPGSPLLEADRAADYILSRFFPQLRAL
ncbi:hypothetical protein C5O12_02595 [Akkermansia muciniphila]|nr:hypothetical protein C1O59_02600 [Akkermansia muciniphila]QAA63710.1 hypothetical protein C1O60_02620 [Akkermansia muciniphila]QAA65964.1 hypothetical protein C1O61_02670 [Akkermansia muciniphila]QAA68223.1 hypothetical protein C1O62_02615 [Akkermansia muciniphila]QHV20625.1 hypothetical protein C5O12_02595 [Akkermansia muciniphila]